MTEKGNLTTGNILGHLVSFALPFLFSSFMQAFYGAVDMWTIGRFSTTANLAAVNTGAQVTQIVTGFCVGLSMGTTVLIGHSVGAKNKKAASSALGNSIWLFIILAAILTPVMVLGSSPITAIMHTPDEAVSAASTYIVCVHITEYRCREKGKGCISSKIWHCDDACVWDYVLYTQPVYRRANGIIFLHRYGSYPCGRAVFEDLFHQHLPFLSLRLQAAI